MNNLKTSGETDFEKLGRLKIFSWLNPAEVKVLGTSLKMLNYRNGEVFLRESEFADEAHVLVAGIARVTCLNAHNERATVALVAPGPIPELPSLTISRFDFRCEAYNNCRVGTFGVEGLRGHHL
jgi:hypothetical protein